MRRAAPAFIAIVLAFSAVSGAQAPPTSTAQVAGTVVTADATPAPVARAVVTLRGDGLLAFSEVSDAQGRFLFTGLPAGRYAMTAAKPAFITATYGARRPGRPGTPLSVVTGQTVADVRLVMARGAAISGIVRDPLGRPAPRVEVLVRPAGADVEASIGGRGLVQLLTDDRGMYRAYGLAAGAYVVAAVPSLHVNSVEVQAMTPAEIDAALRSLQGPKPSAVPASPMAPQPGARKKYVPTFHPGVASQTEATPITVNAGDDVGGVDITLALVSSVSIEGRIIRADGSPLVEPRVIISGTGGRMPVSFNSAPVLQALPRADGRFTYTSIAPGEYKITARDGAGYFAIANVTISGDDLSDLTLALQPGLTFSGQLRFDAAALKPPDNLSALEVTVRPPGARGGGTAVANNTYLGVRSAATAYAMADGTFEVRGIMPGIYVPSTTAPATWWLRSVLVNDRDLLDEVLLLERSVSSAVIVLTDRRSELSGLLQTSGAAPAVEYFVLVLSADRRHWFEGSRRTRTARPGSDGRYIFTDLPAGDYLVAALEDVDPKQLGDPAFLEAVVTAAAAVKVSVGEGAKVQLDLKIGR